MGSSVTFSFCYISYASSIFSEYASTQYWASVTSGSLTAKQTGYMGQYQVTAVSGSRQVTTNDGTYTIASTAFVSLLSGYTSYVYYQSPLTGMATSLDASGLALTVSPAQTDPTGCTGSPVVITTNNLQCPNLNTSSVYNIARHRAARSHVLHVQPADVSPDAGIQLRHRRHTDFSVAALRATDLNVSMNGYTIFLSACAAAWPRQDCQRAVRRRTR